MCFKGITSIRAEESNPSAGFEDADHFTDRAAVILYVFNYFVAEDQVKGPGRKRNKFPGGVENMARVGMRFHSALKVVFQSNDFAAKRGEMLHIHSYTASIFKNAPFDAISC